MYRIKLLKSDIACRKSNIFVIVFLIFTLSVDAQEKNSIFIPVIYDKYEDLATQWQNNSDTIYVINFWATWCKPCVEELPYFEQLREASRGKAIKVMLVSLDFKKRLDSSLIPFLRKNNIQSKVVVLADKDANTWIDKVHPNWSGAIPATLFVKGEAYRFYEQSFSSYKALEKIIQSLSH